MDAVETFTCSTFKFVPRDDVKDYKDSLGYVHIRDAGENSDCSSHVGRATWSPTNVNLHAPGCLGRHIVLGQIGALLCNFPHLDHTHSLGMA